jgi:hypothetical protein
MGGFWKHESDLDTSLWISKDAGFVFRTQFRSFRNTQNVLEPGWGLLLFLGAVL